MGHDGHTHAVVSVVLVYVQGELGQMGLDAAALQGTDYRGIDWGEKKGTRKMHSPR